ncbi:MAG: hypothetical protein RI894_1906 [Bacteroidota bacterium]|jgi:hypothetical protein
MIFMNMTDYKKKGKTALFIGLLGGLFFVFCLSACGSKSKADFDTDLQHCPQKPSPIFREGMNGVKSAKFDLQKTQSIENIVFADNSTLEIIQMGCAQISQEFRFELTKKQPNRAAAEVAEVAAAKFAAIAQLDTKLVGLGNWSGMLKAVKDSLKIGEPIELEPHHFLKLDCLSQNENSLLIVTIFEK